MRESHLINSIKMMNRNLRMNESITGDKESLILSLKSLTEELKKRNKEKKQKWKGNSLKPQEKLLRLSQYLICF